MFIILSNYIGGGVTALSINICYCSELQNYTDDSIKEQSQLEYTTCSEIEIDVINEVNNLYTNIWSNLANYKNNELAKEIFHETDAIIFNIMKYFDVEPGKKQKKFN